MYHSDNLDDAPESIGVYAIYLTSSPKKAYIGSSSNLRRRFKRHFRDLENNKHANYKLKRLYRTRRGDFRIVILKQFDNIKDARDHEQRVIDLSADKNLYNVDMTVYNHRND